MPLRRLLVTSDGTSGKGKMVILVHHLQSSRSEPEPEPEPQSQSEQPKPEPEHESESERSDAANSSGNADTSTAACVSCKSAPSSSIVNLNCCTGRHKYDSGASAASSLNGCVG